MQTAAEVEDAWISHFSGIEAGVKSDPAALAALCQRRQSEQDLESYTLALEDVPTRADLEASLRRTHTGRASGLDDVPGEVWHFAANSASRALFQLFLKCSLRAAEPLQWKGGRLVATWKGKQNPALCSSHRGILISSTAGKSVHSLVRDRCVPALRSIASPLQVGGLPRYPVVFASHMIRMFQQGCRRQALNHALVFLDLREAFYRVVRGLLNGADLTPDGVDSLLSQVKLPKEVAHDLQRHLTESSLVSGAGASDWASYGMREILSETWFRFQGSEQVVHTRIGSRPGDNCADVAFGFIFAHVLRRVHATILPLGCLPSLPWHPDMQGCILPVHTAPSCWLSPMDSTWMDDAALMVQVDKAGDLADAVVRVTSSLVDECLGRALLPNLDRGKTEAIVCPVGRDSRRVKAALFAASSPELPLACVSWPSARLRLVSGYVHLGGKLHFTGALSRELRHRAALAWTAFVAKKKRVFASPLVAQRDKSLLFSSLISTVLMHGAGSWPSLDAKELAILSTALHGMAFHMLRPAYDYEAASRLGGPRALALAGVASAATHLHVARLRHLSSVLALDSREFWAMAHWEQTWLVGVRASLAWMWRLLDGGKAYGSWQAAWADWRQGAASRRCGWRALVRKAQKQALQEELWASAVAQHQGLLCRQLRLAGAATPPCVEEARGQTQCCAPCAKVFSTLQKWAVHAFKTHGRHTDARTTQSGLQCQACLLHFTTHVKLCRHLQYSAKCRYSLRASGHACVAQPGHGSRRAGDLRASQAPAMQALGPLLPLDSDEWVDEQDRPSAEVLDCLALLSYDGLDIVSSPDTFWCRVRQAFSCVCLPVSRIRATASAWACHIPAGASAAHAGIIRSAAAWIGSADVVTWLVPDPAWLPSPVCTFRDSEQVLQQLVTSGIELPSVSDGPLQPVLIGPAATLSLWDPSGRAVWFTHAECLSTIAAGGLPSFFEGPYDEVAFIVSTDGLRHFSPLPIPPVGPRVFEADLPQATLSGDLIRLCWRLWVLGVPTTLFVPRCTDPLPFDTVPGLICGGFGQLRYCRSRGFPWATLPPFLP